MIIDALIPGSTFSIGSIIEIASDVGTFVARKAGQRVSMEDKGRDDMDTAPNLVTAMDHWAEQQLIYRLGALDPTATFWTEESRSERPSLDRAFVIDPIDGTNNYWNGSPIFAVNIGYVVEGQMVAAVTWVAREGAYWAVKDMGTWYRRQQLQVHSSSLAMSQLAMGVQPRNWPRFMLDRILYITQSVRCVRIFGSIAAELAWLSRGRVDCWLGGGQSWDVWPGSLLIQEAGGVFQAIDGNPFDPNANQPIYMAGAPALLEELQGALTAQL